MKTKTIILLTGVMMLSWGCGKDLLNVKNENNYTDVSYFKTQAQFNEAIIATYAVFNNGGMMSREWYFIFDLLANDAERASPLVGTEQELAEYEYTPNNDDLTMMWASLYRMVFRANLALHVMDGWTPQDDAEAVLKKQYTAEAHWLRGFAYFYLVTNWGRVPLRLDYESSKVNAVPRASVEDVWSVVESEFKQAIPDLPVRYPSEADRGRATRGAAMAFLGKTFLFQKKYDSAIQELKPLTAAPFGYTLDPSFDHLFSEDNINSPEVVFAVNHVYTTPNTQYYMFGGWEGADGKTAHTGRAQEYGFNDWENVIASNALVSAFKYPNPVTGASYTDPRSRHTYYGTVANGGDPDFCNTCASGVLAYPYHLFGNSWRKYEPYESQQYTEAPMSGINTMVVRYADVLLMLAESYIEKGSDLHAAMALINEVRARPGIGAVPYPLTLSQGQARIALRRERQLELAGEQSRWLDLNRWGIAVQVLTAEKPAGPGQKPFLAKYVLFPIPTGEIETNPAVASDIAEEWN